MNPRQATRTLTALTVAAALTATLAGCNSSADAKPPETIGTCTECTTAPTPTPTSATMDAAAQEKADRAAAEVVWRKYLVVLQTIETMPAANVDAVTNAVAVDPSLSGLRNENTQFRAQHKAGYGVIGSSISWPQAIDGKDVAVLKDCADGSQAGILDTATGNKLTAGTVNTPFQGTLHRTPDGWRVATNELLQGVTCTAGK